MIDVHARAALAVTAPWVAVVVAWLVRRVLVVRSRSRLQVEPWGVALARAVHGTALRRVVFDRWRGVTYAVLHDGTVEEFAPLRDRPAPPAPWTKPKRRPSCDPRHVRTRASHRIVAVTTASLVAWWLRVSAWTSATILPASLVRLARSAPVNCGVAWLVGSILSAGLAGACRPIGGVVCTPPDP